MTVSQHSNIRFWVKTLGESLDKCLLWIGTKDAGGYGFFWHEGRMVRAHRVAYLLFYGRINPLLDVLHTCDNPACVSPYHLFQGTALDNSRDALRKGRLAIRERHGKAKLTWEQVREIRVRYAAGKESLRSLSRAYGIASPNVHAIIHNTHWREQ